MVGFWDDWTDRPGYPAIAVMQGHLVWRTVRRTLLFSELPHFPLPPETIQEVVTRAMHNVMNPPTTETAMTTEDMYPKFDADLSPDHETNRKAARSRGLRYDTSRRAYVDEDGCLRRDRFGQKL